MKKEYREENKRLGQKLAEIRKSHNISQAQLSEEAEIWQSHISAYENGHMTVTPAFSERYLSAIDRILAKRPAKPVLPEILQKPKTESPIWAGRKE